MSTTQENRLQLAVLLSRRGPAFNAYRIAQDVKALATIGADSDAWGVHLCNGTREQDKYEKRMDGLKNRATTLLEPYGLEFTLGGDPRGYTFKIIGLPGNTLGGDEAGFGVN